VVHGVGIAAADRVVECVRIEDVDRFVGRVDLVTTCFEVRNEVPPHETPAPRDEDLHTRVRAPRARSYAAT
jgi:hypothetical protein